MPNPTKIADLKPDQKNARKHTERNLDMVEDSLREVGPGRSIFIDEKDVIVAGHATAKAAEKLGLKLKVVDAAPDELVAVRRKDMTPEQKQRAALLDNRTGELSEWDADVLRELRASGVPMDDLWTADEQAALLDDEAAEEPEVTPITVDRPTEVAWVLVGIPLTEWPKNQQHVEALQGASVFTTMALRPK